MTAPPDAARGDTGLPAFTASDVARHYDELDPFYREVWGEHVHHGLWRTGRERAERAVEQLVEHVAAGVALAAGDRVVDVGGGYGGTARYLATHHGARVTAITVSGAQHAYAADAVARAGARLLLGDWLRNELPDASADVVLAVESTEHMADLSLALAEMRRVLRPGGRMAICVWLAAETPRGWQRRHLLEPIQREGRLVTLATAREYGARLSAAGFAGVRFEDLTRRVARTWTVALGRLARRLLTDARYRRFALSSRQEERIFLLAMLRIRAAYATGAMRYGLFLAERAPAPAEERPPERRG